MNWLLSRDPKRLLEKGDDDFSFSLVGVSRFRVSTYKQRGSLAAVIRVVKFDLPDPVQLGVPQTVLDLGRLKKGLVLVTRPAGSGKSTTLACMIDLINRSRNCHVITLEDPIEYLHSHKKAWSANGRFPTIQKAMSRRSEQRCGRRPTSFCWAKCGIMRPSAPP